MNKWINIKVYIEKRGSNRAQKDSGFLKHWYLHRCLKSKIIYKMNNHVLHGLWLLYVLFVFFFSESKKIKTCLPFLKIFSDKEFSYSENWNHSVILSFIHCLASNNSLAGTSFVFGYIIHRLNTAAYFLELESSRGDRQTQPKHNNYDNSKT